MPPLPEMVARLADRHGPWRPPDAEHLRDHGGDIGRRDAIAFVALHKPDRLVSRLAVDSVVASFPRHPPAGREICPHVAWLDQRHMHPERGDLVGERLAVALERELARAVERLNGMPIAPPIELISTIRPFSCARMTGSACLTSRTQPQKFVSI
jgi:hypothetical protein